VTEVFLGLFCLWGLFVGALLVRGRIRGVHLELYQLGLPSGHVELLERVIRSELLPLVVC